MWTSSTPTFLRPQILHGLLLKQCHLQKYRLTTKVTMKGIYSYLYLLKYLEGNPKPSYTKWVIKIMFPLILFLYHSYSVLSPPTSIYSSSLFPSYTTFFHNSIIILDISIVISEATWKRERHILYNSEVLKCFIRFT